MSSHEKAVELMAPAGSMEALSAALRAGADSVYFGVGRLNMRSRSSVPFELDDLPGIVRRCHAVSARAYLALNCTIYDDEMEMVAQVLDAAVACGVDAVIAGDPAVLSAAHERHIPVHLSVQANCSNIETLRFFARYADVVVPARELSLEKITRLCRAAREEPVNGPSGRPVRIEVFAHGALCVAVSGQCGMSLALYNASANRGACHQTCRRRFRVQDDQTGEELVIDNRFVMSPRDLCTIRFLERLVDAGVAVLKIEGRGRSADYVATVTRVYREALDALACGRYNEGLFDDWERRLDSVYHRGFWHGGYYMGQRLEQWAAARDSKASVQREYMGRVENFYQRPGVVEFTLMQAELHRGERLLFMGSTTGAVEAEIAELRADDVVCERAVKGQRLTVALPFKVRRADRVYALRPRQSRIEDTEDTVS